MIRKPVLVIEAPKANSDYAVYKKSAASALSILKFVQTDYFYTPTMEADGTGPTDNSAPAFAIFKDDANPTEEQILDSSVKILRNFTTDDGTTIFFTGYDEDRYNRTWPGRDVTSAASSFHLFRGLDPSTNYVLYWAMKASNATFSGSLGTVSTEAIPTTGSMAMADIGYFGWGGMTVHRTTDFVLPMLYFSMDRSNGDSPSTVAVMVQVGNNPELTLTQAVGLAIQQSYEIAYGRPTADSGYYGNTHIVGIKDPEFFVNGGVVKLKSTYKNDATATLTSTIVLE